MNYYMTNILKREFKKNGFRVVQKKRGVIYDRFKADFPDYDVLFIYHADCIEKNKPISVMCVGYEYLGGHVHFYKIKNNIPRYSYWTIYHPPIIHCDTKNKSDIEIDTFICDYVDKMIIEAHDCIY
jgi:hypothetical protein